MAWISDVNGITIKNFLKKRTILYKDLESVFMDDTSIEFITREGEKIAQKRGIFDDFTALKNLYGGDENDKSGNI